MSSLRRQAEGMNSLGLREELFQRQPLTDDDDFFESHGDQERVQLLKNTETLKKASASLHRAQQVSAQTDDMAVNIMDQLDDQKSTLIRTRNRLTDIDHETERSRVLISSLACKALQNRLILIVIIILEVIILFGVLFYKLYTKYH